jgi:hypothetical protein
MTMTNMHHSETLSHMMKWWILLECTLPIPKAQQASL